MTPRQGTGKSVSPDLYIEAPTSDYDHNFNMEVKLLETDRVQLRPFIPSLHAQQTFEARQRRPDVVWGMVFEWNTLAEVLDTTEEWRMDKSCLTYAIYSRPLSPYSETAPPAQYELAGLIGIRECSPMMKTAELGPVMTFGDFRGTHVFVDSAYLLLKLILDPPALGGFGFRRAAWTAFTFNTGSLAAAKRLGFSEDGVLRSHAIVPTGRPGKAGRPGDDPAERKSSDVWFGTLLWDEWEDFQKSKLAGAVYKQSS